MTRVAWPEGKRFAFSIFDDTDSATLKRVRPVYDLLRDLGFRTTKSVWPLPGRDVPDGGGSTCADPEYRDWVIELQRSGFEIGWHNATFHTSTREETRRGLETFARIFGGYPTAMANHSSCDENLYWGDHRVTGIRRWVYRGLTLDRNRGRFRGHVEGDPLFWADLCRQHLKYCRNFDFVDINTLKCCPMMPYHDPARPYVNYWFAATGGHDVRTFTCALSGRAQERLETEGGACIMYTHLARGFCRDGRLDPEFRRLMESMSRRSGWFVPVSTLLDHLLAEQGHHELSDRERAALERRWLSYKLRVGSA